MPDPWLGGGCDHNLREIAWAVPQIIFAAPSCDIGPPPCFRYAPVCAGEEAADALGVKSGTPGLLVVRTSFDAT